MFRSTRFSPELHIRQKGWIRRWRRHRRRDDRWCRGHLDPRRQSALAKFDRMKGSHWGRLLSGSERLINDFLVWVNLAKSSIFTAYSRVLLSISDDVLIDQQSFAIIDQEHLSAGSTAGVRSNSSKDSRGSPLVLVFLVAMFRYGWL